MKSRHTRQKDLITEAIKKQKGFFHAEQLYDELKAKEPSLGLATIYRNLKTMVRNKELFSYTCDRRQVYSKTKQHCHYIDEKTGQTMHFEIDNLDFLKNKIPGSISSVQIEVKGNMN